MTNLFEKKLAKGLPTSASQTACPLNKFHFKLIILPHFKKINGFTHSNYS